MLQKKVARLERANERDGIELTLIFAFLIQPRRQRHERIRIRVLPIGDRARNQSFALCWIGMHLQIEREKFMRRFGERMSFQRAHEIVWRDDLSVVPFLGRGGD